MAGIIEKKGKITSVDVEALDKDYYDEAELESYITDHRLEFAGLPEIEPHVRDVFLTWLSRALENKNCRAKTEDGQVYHIEQADTKETCILNCTDGVFYMPAYTIIFEKKSDTK